METFHKKISTTIRVMVLTLGFFVSFWANAQSDSLSTSFFKPSDSLNQPRRNAVYIGESVVLGATLIGLHQIWYKDYPQSNFHVINDDNQWKQMDKIGHFYSTYHLGRAGAELLQWSGASQKEQLIYGAGIGFAFLTAVEIFDGFSQEWGFSWGDMIANASGTGLYIGQELLWKEQRIIPKFSFHQTKFAAQRPETLGSSFQEQILKDYNGQTYWLSFNLHAFTKNDFFPKWLNVAIGHSATGMLYGNSSEANWNGYNQKAYRQFLLSLDVDLTKIETNSHFLKTLFSVFTTLKVPAPALQLDEFNGLRGYFIYF